MNTSSKSGIDVRAALTHTIFTAFRTGQGTTKQTLGRMHVRPSDSRTGGGAWESNPPGKAITPPQTVLKTARPTGTRPPPGEPRGNEGLRVTAPVRVYRPTGRRRNAGMPLAYPICRYSGREGDRRSTRQRLSLLAMLSNLAGVDSVSKRGDGLGPDKQAHRRGR